MSLTIITNERSFDSETTSTSDRHLGTRDRFDACIQYDYPGKAVGCLKAAKLLQHRTRPESLSTILGPLIDGNGKLLDPIAMISSSRMPELKELEVGHDIHYLQRFAECVARSKACSIAREDCYLSDFGKEADVTPGTLDAARLAVGAAYDMIDTLLHSHSGDTAFGLVWPPGHHAERDLAMGFCYLSNAALAAIYARDHGVAIHPGRSNRVVVIDIDHHRGNGTAHVLADQEDTLLIDISYRSPYDEGQERYIDGRYDAGEDRYQQAAKEYPYSRPDKYLELEAHPMVVADNIVSVEFDGEQQPNTILDRFLSDVLPRVRAFCPDLVLWSVGLDSAMGDPIGGLGNLPSSFYTMIRGLRLAIPNARHGGLLEGGYDELRWYTCLPPALLAFHDRPEDTVNRCKVFSRFRPAFALGLPKHRVN